MAILKAGISFGELGVLYQTNRTASCIALTKVTVMSIHYKIFQAILGDYIKNLNRKRFEYLSKLRIFNGWDRSKLGGLLNHIYVRQPMHSEYIYKTGGYDQNIYVIITGEVEITIECDEERSEEFRKLKNFNPEKSELDSKTKDFQKGYQKKKFMPLLKLTPGNYFGDEDGFNSEKKSYNAKVISNNCKIFLIPKEKIILNVKEPHLLQQIYDVSEQRKEMLKERVNFLKNVNKNQARLKERPEIYLKEEKEDYVPDLKPIEKKKGFRGFLNKALHRIEKRQLFRPKERKVHTQSRDSMFGGLDRFLGRMKTNMRAVDTSFDNCFSNIFKDPKLLKRQRKRAKNLEQNIIKSKEMPKEAKLSRIRFSINQLRKIKLSQKYNEMRLITTGNNFSGLAYSQTPTHTKNDLFHLTSSSRNKSIDYGSLKYRQNLSELANNNTLNDASPNHQLEMMNYCQEKLTEYKNTKNNKARLKLYQRSKLKQNHKLEMQNSAHLDKKFSLFEKKKGRSLPLNIITEKHLNDEFRPYDQIRLHNRKGSIFNSINSVKLNTTVPEFGETFKISPVRMKKLSISKTPKSEMKKMSGITNESLYNFHPSRGDKVEASRSSFDLESKFRGNRKYSNSSRVGTRKKRLLKRLTKRRTSQDIRSLNSSKTYRIERSYNNSRNSSNLHQKHFSNRDNLSMDHIYELHKIQKLKQLSQLLKLKKKLKSPPIQEGSLVMGDQRLNKSDCNDIRGVFSPVRKNISILREKSKLRKKHYLQLKYNQN